MKALISNVKIGEGTKKNLKSKVDNKLLILIISLLTLGTIMVFSASYPYALSHYGDGYYYLKRQAVFLLIGLLAMYFMSKLHIQFLKKIAPIFYVICVYHKKGR